MFEFPFFDLVGQLTTYMETDNVWGDCELVKQLWKRLQPHERQITHNALNNFIL